MTTSGGCDRQFDHRDHARVFKREEDGLWHCRVRAEGDGDEEGEVEGDEEAVRYVHKALAAPPLPLL